MAEITRLIFSEFQGITGELVPGPFEHSEMQLAMELPNGVHLSVLPDVDVPMLFEVVRIDSFRLLGDKLSSARVLELIRYESVAKPLEAAHG